MNQKSLLELSIFRRERRPEWQVFNQLSFVQKLPNTAKQASKNLHNLFRTPCVQRSVRSLASFQAKNLKVVLTDELQTKPDPENLVFGKQFADHMLKIRWTQGDGWNSPVICPLHPLSLHPAAKVFHYAVELFEGMKAYRGADNKIRLFRPAENMSRMNESSKRASLPTFDGEELIKCIKKLISIDKEWVPYSTTSSLYIRPTLVGTEPTLGVTTSSSALLFVIIGPVGPYYPTGMKPITLLADSQFVRSWTGGAGASKMGSNYGPTLMVQNKAVAMGCQQVLWLFGENRQLTEVGAMNLFIYWINENGEHELVTPPLNGLILPGVTRKSLLELTRQWGEFKVSEREITMFDFQKALNENRVKEVFGSGTACVVCPVKAIQYEGQRLTIPTDDNSPLTNRCLKELTDIQFGRTPSDWTVVVE